MQKDCIDRGLQRVFARYGHLLAARRPVTVLCILLPLLVSAGLSAGFTRLTTQSDVEYLFTPTDGAAKTERDTHRKLFPFDQQSGYYPNRRADLAGQLQVILQPRRRGGALQATVQAAARRVHDVITGLVVRDASGAQRQYGDLCGTRLGRCVQPEALQLNLSLQVSPGWPLHRGVFLGTSYGDVTLRAGRLASAGLLRLAYYVRTDAAVRDTGDLWLDSIKDKLSSLQDKDVRVFVFTSRSREQELSRASGDVVLFFSITYTVLTTFTIVSSLSTDWVISKPWLAFTGVVSAGLATVSSYGLLLLCGVEFTSQIATTPFLIIGVGVDDVFIITDAWRQTRSDKPTAAERVTDRMRDTMRRSAVSITITSLTNVLVFVIGTITTFRSVQLFCAYAGVGIIFCYLYAVTFFAGFVVVCGLREETGRHCYAWCVVVRDIQKSKQDTCWYKFCCQSRAPRASLSTAFFRRWFSWAVTTLPGRVCILLGYGLYISLAVWGVTTLEQGLDLRNLANDGSYMAEYITQENKFTDFGLPINVMLTDQLNYSTTDTQKKIHDLKNKLSQHPYMTNFTESWLDAYMSFRSILPSNSRPNSETNFTAWLGIFLKQPGVGNFRQDVNIQDSPAGITSSRFIVYSKAIKRQHQAEFVENIRKTAKESGLPAVVFHPAFIYYDQYLVILPNTLQNLGIAVACMFVIALFIIPGFIGPVLVTVSVVSIEVGVIGFMALWGVSLDAISMINIILCIGFSVDFSSHITYHYMSDGGKVLLARVTSSLAEMGFPIVQGCVSTVLGVVVLFASQSYIFRTFAKTILLVMLFGTLHALLVLPAVFYTIDSMVQRCVTQTDSDNQERPSHDLGHVKNREFSVKAPTDTGFCEASYQDPGADNVGNTCDNESHQVDTDDGERQMERTHVEPCDRIHELDNKENNVDISDLRSKELEYSDLATRYHSQEQYTETPPDGNADTYDSPKSEDHSATDVDDRNYVDDNENSGDRNENK